VSGLIQSERRQPFDWGWVASVVSVLQGAVFFLVAVAVGVEPWQYIVAGLFGVLIVFFGARDNGADLSPLWCLAPSVYYGVEILMVDLHAFAREFAPAGACAIALSLAWILGVQALRRRRFENAASTGAGADVEQAHRADTAR